MYSNCYYNKQLRDPGRELRSKKPTRAENKIWYEFLRFIKPRTHRQRSMGRFIADFYIPKAALIIEIDGDVHSNEKAIAKDLERTTFFNELGITVIRFSNSDVLYNFRQVCDEIKKIILSKL